MTQESTESDGPARHAGPPEHRLLILQSSELLAAHSRKDPAPIL